MTIMDNWLLYFMVVAAIGIGWWLGRREASQHKTPETLGPNYYNGYQRVAFSSTLNSFTLFQHAYGYRAGEFDFFVDNVSFDLAQTGGAGGGGSVSAVPVPAGFPLLAAAFAALGALHRRKRA